MKPKIFIQIDSCDPTNSLKLGQIIKGRVLVHTKGPTDFKCITITFYGTGGYFFDNKNGDLEFKLINDTPAFAKDMEDNLPVKLFFKEQKNLIGNENEKHQLPKGDFTFPFEVTFPSDILLISSFEFPSTMVHVRYRLVVELQRPLFKYNSIATQNFVVNAPYNLNNLPDKALYCVPKFLCSEEKYTGCCFYRSGPIYCQIELAKTAFAPGEFVNFKGVFINRSKSKMVRHVYVKFQQILIIPTSATIPQREIRVLSAVKPKFSCIAPGREFFWDGSQAMLKIPECPPTNLGGYCKLFDVQYEISFCMSGGRFSEDIVVNFPIIVGTIPLRRS